MPTAHDSLAITDVMRENVAEALINNGIPASPTESLYILTDKIILALSTALSRALADDTVTAASMLRGVTAHNCDCNIVVGTIDSIPATTYIPTTVSQVIEAGQYIAGMQTISGVTAAIDPNIIPRNIRAGAQILGVNGGFFGIATLVSYGIRDNNTCILIDDTDASHTIAYTADAAGNILSASYDGLRVPVTFVDGLITGVGETTITGMENVAVKPSQIIYGGLNANNLPTIIDATDLKLMNTSGIWPSTISTSASLPERMCDVGGAGVAGTYNNVVSVLLPNGTKGISPYAFRGVSRLLYTGSSLSYTTWEKLGEYAFADCNALRLPADITLPKLSYVGQHAFGPSSTSSVTSRHTLSGNVTFGSLGNPVIYMGALCLCAQPDILSLTIYTQNGLASDLTDAPWGSTIPTIIYLQA